MDQTATGPSTLEAKLRARVPANSHVFTGTAPPDSIRRRVGDFTLPAGASTADLPVRVVAEWTTAAGPWHVWTEEVSPGRYNVRIDGPRRDLTLDNITESHLIALLELAGFIEPAMMADLIGPPA